MPAHLSESKGQGPHRLVLPDPLDGQLSAAAELKLALEANVVATGPLQGVDDTHPSGPVHLEAGRWLLDARQLLEIEALLERRGMTLLSITSEVPETRVAAAGLGLGAAAPHPEPAARAVSDGHGADGQAGDDPSRILRLHRGTLRAGDQLEMTGSLLLLGDVNPGASIRASGHVLVWGRLRGNAHAGCDGDEDARIVALQLRPLQLRIAGAVARGPEGLPPAGLAEEAALTDGVIQIRPAAPGWPLSD